MSDGAGHFHAVYNAQAPAQQIHGIGHLSSNNPIGSYTSSIASAMNLEPSLSASSHAISGNISDQDVPHQDIHMTDAEMHSVTPSTMEPFARSDSDAGRDSPLAPDDDTSLTSEAETHPADSLETNAAPSTTDVVGPLTARLEGIKACMKELGKDRRRVSDRLKTASLKLTQNPTDPDTISKAKALESNFKDVNDQHAQLKEEARELHKSIRAAMKNPRKIFVRRTREQALELSLSPNLRGYPDKDPGTYLAMSAAARHEYEGSVLNILTLFSFPSITYPQRWPVKQSRTSVRTTVSS